MLRRQTLGHLYGEKSITKIRTFCPGGTMCNLNYNSTKCTGWLKNTGWNAYDTTDRVKCGVCGKTTSGHLRTLRADVCEVCGVWGAGTITCDSCYSILLVRNGDSVKGIRCPSQGLYCSYCQGSAKEGGHKRVPCSHGINTGAHD